MLLFGCLLNAQYVTSSVQQFDRKIGVKDEKSLTRNTKRQFHSRKYNDSIFLRYRITIFICLILCGSTNVFDEDGVMMVCNRYGIQTIFTTRLNELHRVFLTLLISNRSWPRPLAVARRMDLEITVVEVGTIIHKSEVLELDLC